MAEGVGFEPTVPCGTAVFKTAALNQTRPSLRLISRGHKMPQNFEITSQFIPFFEVFLSNT